MSDEKDELTGHNYDGIEEYDNPLPLWWLITFFATIIFSGIYWLHYESGAAPTQIEMLKSDLADIEKLKERHQHALMPTESEDVLAGMALNTETIESGKKIFSAKCIVCHGSNLEGQIGPNLVDNFWIHGRGKLTDIISVVRGGVAEKGMPSWLATLSDSEIKSVVAFVYSKYGSNPANAKAPQGEKVDSP